MTFLSFFSMVENIVFALRKYYFLFQNILLSNLENDIFYNRKQMPTMGFHQVGLSDDSRMPHRSYRREPPIRSHSF